MLESRARGPPPVALWRPGSGHRLCPARGASLFRRPRGWQRRRGCHPRSPRPGRRPGGQRPGGAAACPADPLAVRSPRARPRCGEQAGWKGVCERGALGALLAVTSHTKPGFQSCRSVEGRGALRIAQPLLERHQGARCSGDAGTRRRIWFAEMPEAKCRARYSRHLLRARALGGRRWLHWALVDQLGHLRRCEVGEEKAEVWVGCGWDGNTALGNTRSQVFEAGNHSKEARGKLVA